MTRLHLTDELCWQSICSGVATLCVLHYWCVALKTLHSMKCIPNEEECRSIGEAGRWWKDELAVVLATKPPGVVQGTLGVLEKYKGQWWYSDTTNGIKSELCCRSQLV